MIEIFVALFIGWNLGANDAANIFGTAVSNKIIKFYSAALIAIIFVIIGAVIGGEEGVKTYEEIASTNSVVISSIIGLSAAISVFIMTGLKIPVSMTHAMLAGVVVSGLLTGGVNYTPVMKMGASWFISPVSTMVISYLIYRFTNKRVKSLFRGIGSLDKFIKITTILVGIYGSYSLGANNVANVVGVFVYSSEMGIYSWLILGGVAISIGIITFSKRVMGTVGSEISKMDNYGAMIAVLSSAIVIHIYSIYGIPVSSSQSIVGAVVGIGLIEGMVNVNFKVLRKVVLGWIYSISVSGFLTFVLIKLFVK